MHLSKEIFDNHYKSPHYRGDDDPMTKAVEDFLNDDANFTYLEELNKKGIPPAAAFIGMTYKENGRKFGGWLKTDADKQYFGKLFGAAFYEAGYEKEKEKPLHIHNASVFKN